VPNAVKRCPQVPPAYLLLHWRELRSRRGTLTVSLRRRSGLHRPVALLAVAIYSQPQVKTKADYLVAGRSLPAFVILFAYIGITSYQFRAAATCCTSSFSRGYFDLLQTLPRNSALGLSGRFWVANVSELFERLVVLRCVCLAAPIFA